MNMALRLAVLKSVFNSYNTKAFPLTFLFMALVYFIIKDKKDQRNLLMYEIFGILLLVTPFIGNKIITLGAGSESNWSVYGILCAIPITAYMAADILKHVDARKEKGKLLVVFVLVMQLGLGFSVTGEQFAIPQNVSKTSSEAVEMAEILNTAEDVYVMAPIELAGELRMYSSDIRVFYDESYDALQQELELLQSEADVYGCNCIILSAMYDDETVMLAGGYEKKACIEDYVLYMKHS